MGFLRPALVLSLVHVQGVKEDGEASARGDRIWSTSSKLPPIMPILIHDLTSHAPPTAPQNLTFLGGLLELWPSCHHPNSRLFRVLPESALWLLFSSQHWWNACSISTFNPWNWAVIDGSWVEVTSMSTGSTSKWKLPSGTAIILQ